MAGTVDSTGNTLTALAVGLLAQVVQQQQQLRQRLLVPPLQFLRLHLVILRITGEMECTCIKKILKYGILNYGVLYLEIVWHWCMNTVHFSIRVVLGMRFRQRRSDTSDVMYINM